MIKAKVIKPFYYANDKELYLDEDRYKELLEKGYVEPIEEVAVMPIDEIIGNKEITNQIEKAIINKPKLKNNDKARVLSN